MDNTLLIPGWLTLSLSIAGCLITLYCTIIYWQVTRISNIASLLEKKFESSEKLPTKKMGELGEVIAGLKFKAEYDLLVYGGPLSDLIGVKFDPEDSRIDFIEVKTNTSNLSKNQRMIKGILNKKAVSYKTFKVQDISVYDETSGSG